MYTGHYNTPLRTATHCTATQCYTPLHIATHPPPHTLCQQQLKMCSAAKNVFLYTLIAENVFCSWKYVPTYTAATNMFLCTLKICYYENVFLCTNVFLSTQENILSGGWQKLTHRNTQCNTLQHTASGRNTLLHTAMHCNTLQHQRYNVVVYFERITT